VGNAPVARPLQRSRAEYSRTIPPGRLERLQAVEHGVFCELGQGDIDFPAILAKLAELHYQGWIVVEQDVLPGMGSPKASAHRNREYLRSIGV